MKQKQSIFEKRSETHPKSASHDGRAVGDGSCSIVIQEGTQIGNYEIKALLGAGGMGAVYRALDMALKRTVAVKFVHASGGKHERTIKRFMKEAEICAKLDHPHIVKTFHAGAYLGTPYLVMEYIEGKTVLEYIEERNASLQERMGILAKIAHAVHYAHSRNVIHRDIKPSNIMVRTGGEPVLMDFGVARLADEKEQGLTRTGELMGSPHYMAPEQFSEKRREIDERTDVYGLGAVMYHFLTKRRPVEGDTLIEIAYQAISVPPISPRALVPDLPEALDEICMTALEKKKAIRHPSAALFASRISACLEGKMTGYAKAYRKKRNIRNVQRYCRVHRKKIVLLASIAVISACLALGTWVWKGWEAESQWESVRHYARGKSLYEEKQYGQALLLFQKASRRMENDPEVHLYLALCHDHLDQPILAEKAFEKAYRKGPDLPRVIYRKGLFHLKMKKYDRASALLSDYLRHRPEDYEGHRERALAYEGMGAFEKAKEERNRADFLQAREYESKANRHEEEREYHQALEQISQAIELYPCEVYHLRKGKWLFQLGYYEECYRHFVSVLQDQKSVEMEEWLLKAAEKMQQYEVAYQQGISLHERKPRGEFSLVLGRVAFHCGRYEKAVEYLGEVISDTAFPPSEKAEALYYCGLAMEKRGLPGLAEENWKKAIALFPRPDAVFKLARHCFERGEIAKATAYLEEEAKTLGNKVLSLEALDVYALLARCYFKEGQFQKAIVFFSHCIALQPWQYEYYQQRGICHNRMGHFPEAEKDFATCVRLKPQEFAPCLLWLDNIFQEGLLNNFMKMEVFLNLSLKGMSTSVHHDFFSTQKMALVEILQSEKPIEAQVHWDENNEGKKYRVFVKGLSSFSPSAFRMAEVGLLSMYRNVGLYERLLREGEQDHPEAVKERIGRVLRKIEKKWEGEFCRCLVRHYAVRDEEALKEIYHRRDFGLNVLVSVLQNKGHSNILRFWAACALGDLKTQKAHEKLELLSQEGELECKILCELVRVRWGFRPKDPAIFFQAGSLQDPYVRSRVAAHVPMENRHAVDLLSEDGDKRVSLIAASRLFSIGQKTAIRKIFQGLNDPDPAVRMFCIDQCWGVGRIENLTLREKMRNNLLPLIEALQDKDPLVRRTAVMNLSRIPDRKNVEVLSRYRYDPDDLTRIGALTGLGRQKQYSLILPVLCDPKESFIVRGALATSINEISRGGSLPLSSLLNLMSKLQNDPDERIRILTFLQTGWNDSPLSTNILLQNSYKEDEATRIGCILGMHNRRKIEFLPRLEELLNDGSEKVRGLAAGVLIYLVGIHEEQKLSEWFGRFQRSSFVDVRHGAALGFTRLVYKAIHPLESTDDIRWDSRVLYCRFLDKFIQKASGIPWNRQEKWRDGPGTLQEYLECFTKASMLCPEHALIRFEMGILQYLAACRRPETSGLYIGQAIANVERAFASSDQYLYKKWLARLYILGGRHENSWQLLRELLQDDPWDEELWEMKAKNHSVLGQAEESAYAWNRCEYLKKIKNRFHETD